MLRSSVPARRRRRPEVDILDQQPATRLQRGDQAAQHLLAIRDVLQHRTPVDEVERGVGQRVGDHVMDEHLEVVSTAPVEEPGIQVGGDHPAIRTDLVGQPQRHSPGTAAHLQAPPPGTHAKLAHQSAGAAAEQGLQRLQPVPLPLPRLVEDVRTRVLHHLWSQAAC